MSEKQAAVASSFFLFLALFTKLSWADGYTREIDESYLRDLIVSEKTRILNLNLTFETVPPPTYRSPKKVVFFQNPKVEKEIICTFTDDRKPRPMDCGLLPFSVGGYDINYGFSFVVKEEKGDWIQVYADPKGSRTLWFNPKQTKGITTNVELLVRSILGYYKFTPEVKTKEIEIYEKPDDKGKVTATCPESVEASHEFKGTYTSIPEEVTYLDEAITQVVQGDFVRVTCDRGSKCFTEDSRNNPQRCDQDDDTVAKIMQRRKKLPLCPQGWARWRTPLGKLRIYPTLLTSLCD